MEVLGLNVTKAIDMVELEVSDSNGEPDTITVDEILMQYLSQDSVQALSEVGFHDECAGWELTLRGLELGNMRLGYGYWRCLIQGKSLLVIVLVVASLFVGADVITSLLKSISGLP
jgi:hypothetical protein